MSPRVLPAHPGSSCIWGLQWQMTRSHTSPFIQSFFHPTVSPEAHLC